MELIVFKAKVGGWGWQVTRQTDDPGVWELVGECPNTFPTRAGAEMDARDLGLFLSTHSSQASMPSRPNTNRDFVTPT